MPLTKNIHKSLGLKSTWECATFCGHEGKILKGWKGRVNNGQMAMLIFVFNL